ncbi:MAG TPA: twin-arginine translocase TatA/TatE family subunit [Candidatus Dormibacteraeota bacterium]
MFGVHPLFIVALVLVVLIIFGPGRLPELGGAIGKGIREFRKATDELKDEVTRSVSKEDNPAETASPTPSTAEPTKTESKPS